MEQRFFVSVNPFHARHVREWKTKTACDNWFITGLSAVYQQDEKRFFSWLLTSGPSLFGFCKPFSCKACPGIKANHISTSNTLHGENFVQHNTCMNRENTDGMMSIKWSAASNNGCFVPFNKAGRNCKQNRMSAARCVFLPVQIRYRMFALLGNQSCQKLLHGRPTVRCPTSANRVK